MRGLATGLLLAFVVSLGAAAMRLSVRRYKDREMWIAAHRKAKQRRLDAWANALRARWEGQGFRKRK